MGGGLKQHAPRPDGRSLSPVIGAFVISKLPDNSKKNTPRRRGEQIIGQGYRANVCAN